MNICLEPFENIKLENETMNNIDQINMSNGVFIKQEYPCWDFTKADLSASTFEGCDFSEADLGYADLTNTDFIECTFHATQFTSVDCLDGTNFFACDLRNADFTDSVLNNVCFNSCNMDNCNFEDAELIGCSMQIDEGGMFAKTNIDIAYWQIATAIVPLLKHGNVDDPLIDKLVENNIIRQILEKIASDELTDNQVSEFIDDYYYNFKTLF